MDEVYGNTGDASIDERIALTGSGAAGKLAEPVSIVQRIERGTPKP